ncbi:MAG: aminotransferase class V-fold PLP-dependent enzyme [Nevskiaceae bacterium]|nr:MAG: aminotransferase class V-fold PLP-dependent enzyme [Nevskiaceae bacterium]
MAQHAAADGTAPSAHTPIYLDYAATTPVDPAVLQAMLHCLETDAGATWANAASAHAAGLQARAVVEHAREQVAALIHATPGEIVFTSGATESNNLAIKGAVEFNRTADRPAHLVTSRTEHRCVLDTCRWLETRGVRVTWLVPGPDGRVDPAQVLAALRPETLLVSLMWVNNETGAVNDIAALAPELRARGVMLHVDAVQAAGKLAIDVQQVPVDLLSLSAHKIYGPKGIGALFVRRRPRARLAPQMHGGGHEQGMRSGTLANHQIAGFGVACELAAQRQSVDARRMAGLRERLWVSISGPLPQVLRNGPDPALPGACAPHVLNVSFAGVDGEALRSSLPEIAVSSGSACSSATAEPSYVLRALGRDDILADASLRFSLGRMTMATEVDAVAAAVVAAVQRLRALSPLWTDAVPPAAATAVPNDPFDYSPVVWENFWRAAPAPLAQDAATVQVQTPASRAVLALGVRCVDGTVVEAGFRAFGDPTTIAVGAWLARQCRGQRVDTLAGLTAVAIRAALGIGEDRLHCSLLGEDAVRALLRRLAEDGRTGHGPQPAAAAPPQW